MDNMSDLVHNKDIFYLPNSEQFYRTAALEMIGTLDGAFDIILGR